MIHLKPYQEEAVNTLTFNTFKLLKRPGARQPLVFKAPTGAGKTIMIAAFLNKFCEELPDHLDLEKRQAAFIWIAPNKLYIQSYRALKSYFAELRSLRPVFFDDISGDALQPNDVLFVNWESINKEKNLMVKDNEHGRTLYNYVNQARLHETEIIVIIDEEHMFANTLTAKRATEVLQGIYPKLEIRVSATPTTPSDYKVIVERHDVIQDEMIKEGIILNPALDQYLQTGGKSLEQILMDIALEKREEIRQAYQKLGLSINPLLLIQLPNDTSESETVEDKKYIDTVIHYLESKDISTSNHKLAVWLSGKKDNLDGIEAPDNMVEVLLFKQAIALGWDCPRAAVLVIFRELHSTTFTIQTVGRILRMPEQKHYPDALLNQGYVFTNLSKDRIVIVQDDMSYISMDRAVRKPDYRPVLLESSFINTRIDRNRLGSKFRLALYQTAEALWGVHRDLSRSDYTDESRQKLTEKLIELDVSRIDIVIPENVHLSGGVEVIRVDETVRFAKTEGELMILFRQFCRDNVGGYAPVDSTPVLEMALKLFFEEYLAMSEFEAVKVVLYEQNKPSFIELIARALEAYEQLLQQQANKAKKDVAHYAWEVPSERIYNDTYEANPKECHVLEPYFQLKRASKPEVLFSDFLVQHKAHIAWWYKNGDNGKEHFAVPYTDARGTLRLFYVDFVILTKSGITCLFDTKTAGSDPAAAHLKHNALVDYIAQRNQQGKPTIGGVLIGNETGGTTTWRYCTNKIENTHDLTGWDYFNPALVQAY
ncbi:DEAD/DEAH box helicase [Telluribacter sp. SYSU D00476]|uniref:DEAD/DEAH box helicase n=1 Tax=Telluribacter sp. SYSU D00476 TaxID=2811430 RepID=UPI001FF17931|nr:DEAD/DEAH box helicase family protein [Telluribacter sp. SYSU D00476]